MCITVTIETTGTTMTGIPTMDVVSYYYIITIRAEHVIINMYLNTILIIWKLQRVQLLLQFVLNTEETRI